MSRLYEKITTKAASSCCIKQEKRSPDSSQQQIHDQQPPMCGLESCIYKGLLKQENHKQAVAQDTDSNKVPHNYEEILKNSDLDLLHRPLFKSSHKMIFQQLHDGVFLSDRKMFYWVDKKNNNCFMIFPKDLKITSSLWDLHTAQTSDLGKITIAKLRPDVVTFKMSGGINTRNLSPGVTYQVVFVIMLEYRSYGWEEPMSFSFRNFTSETHIHTENLNDKPKGEWLRIQAGEFVMISPLIEGEIQFSLYQNGKTLKKGLIIKSVNFEAK